MSARCGAWISTFDGDIRCPERGTQVRLACPAGRPDVVAAYCDSHGGEARAREEAERDWNYVAPESVGDAEAVLVAGCASLQSPDVYLVVRQVPESQGGMWLAWLGLGSMLEPVVNPSPIVRLQSNGKPRTRGGSRVRRSPDTPSHSFPSREAALSRGREAWESGVRDRVEEIRQLRGGTLTWGVPVEPRGEPIIIMLEQGDTRSAWDVVAGMTGEPK